MAAGKSLVYRTKRFLKYSKLDFSELLRAIREEKGLTNEDLAERAGVVVRTIQRWQQPNAKLPNFRQAYRLAFALDIDIDLIDLFLNVAGFGGMNRTEEEVYYRQLLYCERPSSLYEVNEALIEDGWKPFKMVV